MIHFYVWIVKTISLGFFSNMGQIIRDVITLNAHNTKDFTCTCTSKRKYENAYTKKETAKFQGSISTQSKAIGV